MPIRTAVLGMPRIGPDRELKFALERYWAHEIGAGELLGVARTLRAANWERARAAGIDVVPCGDFSLYDHVLDTAWGVGAIPARFGDVDGLDGLFALARGTARQPPLAATKWFDTNYHHLVPELAGGQRFALRPGHWRDALREAARIGVAARPVVLGPFSLLALSTGPRRPLDALDALVPVYEQLLRALADAGAREVQIDEPCLVADRTARELDEFAAAWRALHGAAGVRLCLATYFGAIDLARVLALPMDEVHLDLVRAPQQLAPALRLLRDRATRLSLGIVDGRNVWRTDLGAAAARIDAARAVLGDDRVTIAPSCSLLHVPHDASRETGIDPAVRRRLAFAAQRLEELALLRDGESGDPAEQPAPPRDDAVRARAAAVAPADLARASAAARRRPRQHARLALPELPTTTIGSFPQTARLREARRALRDGALAPDLYDRLVADEIARVVAEQERLGLDVLVHGEPERDDMVESFAARLDGFALSAHGWVQSYGSGCVKPPILHGDVARPAPITVRWWRHAQSLTRRPVKGMLTGPVTLLHWSFARDDQPRAETCRQLALALRDEVLDLERAGAAVIQVDEPALREGLPPRRRDWDGYLRWAVDCFRLTVGGVRDETQIHTHMCYARIADIVEQIARMDADVLSIEAARGGGGAIDAIAAAPALEAAIGPGVYDTHAPRLPTEEEIDRLLAHAERRLGRARVWVNPDCGLKSRRWEEALPALRRMVCVARRRRLQQPWASASSTSS